MNKQDSQWHQAKHYTGATVWTRSSNKTKPDSISREGFCPHRCIGGKIIQTHDEQHFPVVIVCPNCN